MKKIPLLFLFSALIISCSTTKNIRSKTEKNLSLKNDEIARILKNMPLKEKICQLFIVRLQSLDVTQTAEDIAGDNKKGITEISKDLSAFYQEYPCGGVILFSSEIKNPDQLKKLTAQIHALKSSENSMQPFIYIDEEGGKVARLARNPEFKLPQYEDMTTIAETENTRNALDAGRKIGKYLNEYGIDVDFAPVADVNTNPKNPVIGRRAFGEKPETAAEMAVSFYEGLSENNIYGCFKHFPGHGDSKTDTHTGYAKTDKTWQELLNCEIIPFKAGIENNVQFIMTAHITAPEVDPKKVPSTLSEVLLTDKLRGELGYKGLIVTDGMEMGAITRKYNPQKASLNALLAGADLILCPYDYKKTVDTILKAVKTGKISESRIDESVRRILELKTKAIF